LLDEICLDLTLPGRSAGRVVVDGARDVCFELLAAASASMQEAVLVSGRGADGRRWASLRALEKALCRLRVSPAASDTARRLEEQLEAVERDAAARAVALNFGAKVDAACSGEMSCTLKKTTQVPKIWSPLNAEESDRDRLGEIGSFCEPPPPLRAEIFPPQRDEALEMACAKVAREAADSAARNALRMATSVANDASDVATGAAFCAAFTATDPDTGESVAINWNCEAKEQARAQLAAIATCRINNMQDQASADALEKNRREHERLTREHKDLLRWLRSRFDSFDLDGSGRLVGRARLVDLTVLRH
jgi:hypothetical protein